MRYTDDEFESYDNIFRNAKFDIGNADKARLIGPYVAKDPTAFCSYEDYLLAVETITDFCLLRAESVRGQLDGIIPSTIKEQMEDKSSFIDASSVWLPDMGEVADLKD